MSKTIGQRIRELREQRGLTQAELAKLLGCAANTITEWEKREGRAPGKLLLLKVAAVLDVSVDYLLGKEKASKTQIPCYGEILCEEFLWPNANEPQYYLELPSGEYATSRFSFKVLDDLLEPTVCKSDYCIFEKSQPEDGDIVIARFLADNRAIIRLWRQHEASVMLSETKLHKICMPYFFEIIKNTKESLTYTIKNWGKIVVEGKLVVVKKMVRLPNLALRVHYIA